jgi:hypothetical protein
MSNKIFVLNILFSVLETLICAMCICVFAFMAYHFDKWWISLFSIFPVMGYNGWKMIAEEKERGEESENG